VLGYARAELARRSVQDSAATLASGLVRLALGVLVARLLAGALAPAGLGTFYVVSAGLAILLTLADGGLGLTVVNHIAARREHEPEAVPPLATAALVLKLAFAALVALPLFVFAGPLADLWLHAAGGPALVRLAALGLLASALSGWAAYVAQGFRRLRWLAVAQAVTALAGLSAFTALWAAGRLDLTSAVAVGVLTPLVSFALVAPVGRLRLAFAGLGPPLRALLGFSRWLWLGALLGIIALQLDLLLVRQWLPPQAAGYYGLAGRLAQAADLLNQGNFAALLPVIAARRLAGEQQAYMRATTRRTLPLAVLVLALAWLAGEPIVWFFGAAYAPVVPLFRILMLGVVFDLVTTPLLLLAFPLDMPRTLAAAELIRVVTLAGSAALLLPVLGPAGAAWARLLARLAGAAFTLALVRRRMAARPVPGG
jgi:O-antigen/teichoic acid export membrane protein